MSVDRKEYLKNWHLRNRSRILEHSKKYNHSIQGKIATKKYKKSEKGKANNLKYRQSDKGKRTDMKYNHSTKGKSSRAKYKQSKKGKKANAKAIAKRNRNLQWILMFDNPFADSEQVEYHHINDAYVIALPKDLHKLYYGKYHRENTMEIVKQVYLE